MNSGLIKLDPEAVTRLFNTATTQSDYILGLYKMVHPDFDQIREFKGYPVCSKETWSKIASLAVRFDGLKNKDRDFAKQVMPGGAWMNSGFTVIGGEDLALWYVKQASDILFFKE